MTHHTFGKRQTAPRLPAYECWAPELGKPKNVMFASDSFAARKLYAAHYQIGVFEVAARCMANPEGWQHVDGIALPPITWAAELPPR
jgi:hypothetical protein